LSCCFADNIILRNENAFNITEWQSIWAICVGVASRFSKALSRIANIPIRWAVCVGAAFKALSRIANIPIRWAVCVGAAFKALSNYAEWPIGWAVCVSAAFKAQSCLATWPISWAICAGDAFKAALSSCIAEWQSTWAVCVGGARVEVKAFALTIRNDIRVLVQIRPGRQYLTFWRRSNAIK